MVNITAEHICNFETHGVELIKGLFKDYIDLIREGIEFNMENPGPYAAENLKTGEHGRFFDDYCNWNRISQFEKVIRESKGIRIVHIILLKEGKQLVSGLLWIKFQMLP